MTEDFYDLLETSPDASQDDIKEAYREKVRVYHPDVNDDDRARAQFTALRKAYDVLSDPVERRAYDRLGHEEYVAKRTSGLPSPEVWRRSDDAERSSTTEPSSSGSATATTAGRSDSKTEGDSSSTTGSNSRATGSSTTRGRTGSSQSTDATTDTTSTTGTTDGRASSTATASSSAEASGTTDATTGHSRATGTVSGTASSERESSGVGPDATADGWSLSDNAVVQWWRRRNVSLPLLYASVFVYLAGLWQFALANERGLEAVTAELAATEAGLVGLWTTLSSGRYGVETPASFVLALEPVVPPLEPAQWYLVAAGIVAGAVLVVAADRIVRREETLEPISTDETIFLAVAIAIGTELVGGPLLAGAILMPFLVAVIVYRTRLTPGWEPSYLYVVPVLVPAVALSAGIAGYGGTLAFDLLAFGIVPLAGALALPLRVAIRRRFGR